MLRPRRPANRPDTICTRSPVTRPHFFRRSMAPFALVPPDSGNHFVGHVHRFVATILTRRITPGHRRTSCHCSSILVKQ